MIELYHAPSRIHGEGLFTKGVINQGTLIFNLFFPEIVSDRECYERAKANDLAVEYTALPFIDRWLVSTKWEVEIVRYINHSDTPNCLFFLGVCFAKEHIENSTELTFDFNLLQVKSDCFSFKECRGKYTLKEIFRQSFKEFKQCQTRN